MMQTQHRRMNMRRYGLVVSFMAAVAGLGTAWVKFPGASAQTQPAAVTPKMQAPPEARSLSRAFSSVAKALRPSVVRIDVEVGQPRVARNRPETRNPRAERGEGDP